MPNKKYVYFVSYVAYYRRCRLFGEKQVFGNAEVGISQPITSLQHVREITAFVNLLLRFKGLFANSIAVLQYQLLREEG